MAIHSRVCNERWVGGGIEDQRHAMLSSMGPTATVVGAKSFQDEGSDALVPAAQRPGFAELLEFIREGDTLHVYSIDRLGRDALDVQATVRALLDRGVSIEIHGLGRIARGIGELILAVLAQLADMERDRIKERTAAGREMAKQSLAATGKTHRGKLSLGRPMEHEPHEVAAWRMTNQASIRTARLILL